MRISERITYALKYRNYYCLTEKKWKELVTIKPAYHDYTKWMWQFYITRPRPRLDYMLEFSRTNWNACNDVYKSLTDNDRKLISEYAVQVTNDFAFAGAYAEKNGMTSYNVLNRIKYILQQTAIKRGLWEYQTADRMEPERDVYGKAEDTERNGADVVRKAEDDRDDRTSDDQTDMNVKAELTYADHSHAFGKAERGCHYNAYVSNGQEVL